MKFLGLNLDFVTAGRIRNLPIALAIDEPVRLNEIGSGGGGGTVTVAAPTLAAEILIDAPTGFWKCDETSGTTLADSSGHGFALTLTGTSLNTTPVVIAARSVFETPYRELVLALTPAELALVDSTSGYLSAAGLRPSAGSLNYVLISRIGSSGSFTARASGDFTPTATLVGALTRQTTAAVLANGVNLDLVAVGSAALVDNELCRVDALDVTTGAIALARACGDSVPATHAAAARIWFTGTTLTHDPTEYTSGNSVQLKLLTTTGANVLAPSIAATDTVVMAQRQFRPYPPGNLLANGIAAPVSTTGHVVLTWAHRDRVLQADLLVDTTQASIGPEAGTTYTVRVYDDVTSTLKSTASGLTGTTYTVNITGTFTARVELESQRAGLTSRQKHTLIWAYAYPSASLIAQTGDHLTTQAGDHLVT